ncbi:hypothetical protein F5J12DRAFT_721138 [Pisolithus orientalis]|uniref:uncharacterized protein n=1 Tax=Pisolithus orientalis TaxID=936130 RepID=UPI0022256375|nr:uncharacterized protein F5J12DRAFT_721138 [Pisolithus orientalis]KAI6006210.1 hypothetical protein F5J12DRAFT_721138 [Pisolithus orientalis]
MNSDATEAALGLLGLSPLNHHIQVFDAHSGTPSHHGHGHHTVPPSLIPLKRKQPSPSNVAKSHPTKLANADDISCICGFTYDDGFSIACDVCSRWCHAACFGIVEGGVPEEWRCWVCQGGSIDEEQRERAVKLQRKRLKTLKMRNGPNGNKRRRASILNPAGPSSSANALAAPNANPPTGPDVAHPSSSTSSSRITDVFPPDAYSHPSTHAQLLKVAKAWRGVTALNPPIPVVPPRTYIDGGYVRVDSQGYLFVGPTARLPQSSTTSGLASASGTALGTASHGPTDSSRNDTIAIPSNTLLSPYTATILPSSAYLADPLNGYAHLGMGKPQVRLVGGGWCVGVDARELGGHESLGKGRWARCGCWPNAVVRPVICGGARRRKKKGEGGDRESDNEQKAHSTTLSFGLFALRDLRADEEIVLGWEWDDGHAVHMLPALIESPGMFG